MNVNSMLFLLENGNGACVVLLFGLRIRADLGPTMDARRPTSCCLSHRVSNPQANAVAKAETRATRQGTVPNGNTLFTNHATRVQAGYPGA